MSQGLNVESVKTGHGWQHHPYPTFGFLTLDIRPTSLSSPMPKILNLLNRLSIFASHYNDPRASFSPLTFRLLTFGLLLTFNFSLLISNCGLDVEDPTPPSPPVWVQKSLPNEWPERGIDAHESGGIFLEWQGNLSDDNVNKIHIYRAIHYEINDSVSDFEHLRVIDASNTESYSYLDDSALINIKYLYFLLAEENSGTLSLPSDTITYTLLRQLESGRMSPNDEDRSIGTSGALSWVYDYDIEMEHYTLTIVDYSGNNLVLRQELIPTDYVGKAESYTIPDSIQLVPSSRYYWRVDMGANFVDGKETSGSESEWAVFQFE